MAPQLFDPSRDPFDDVEQALTQARREGKRIMVEIGGDWCIWSRRLDRFIRDHADLNALWTTRYVCVRVFVSKYDATNEEFLRRLPPFTGVPHLIVYDSEGQLLCSQATNPFERGDSYNRSLLKAFLEKWSEPGQSSDDEPPMKTLRQRFTAFFGCSNDDKPTSAA